MLKTLLSLLTVFSLLLCSCGKKQLLSSVKSFEVEEVKDESKDESKSAKSSEAEEVKDESKDESKSAKSSEAEEVKDESKDESKSAKSSEAEEVKDESKDESKSAKSSKAFVVFESLVDVITVIAWSYYIIQVGIDLRFVFMICGSSLSGLSSAALVNTLYYDEEPLFGLSLTSWTLGLLAGISSMGVVFFRAW